MEKEEKKSDDWTDKSRPSARNRQVGGDKKKKEYTGSRWAGVILLLVTVLVSLIFYLRGNSEKVPLPRIDSIFGSGSYTFTSP